MPSFKLRRQGRFRAWCRRAAAMLSIPTPLHSIASYKEAEASPQYPHLTARIEEQQPPSMDQGRRQLAISVMMYVIETLDNGRHPRVFQLGCREGIQFTGEEAALFEWATKVINDSEAMNLILWTIDAIYGTHLPPQFH